MDGVYASQETRQGEITYSDKPLCIGSQNQFGSFPFPGLIDEVGVFNVTLSEGDIKLIMKNGLQEALSGGASVEPQVGLVAVWAGIKVE